jgi:diacylglycerol kinase (ATP)
LKKIAVVVNPHSAGGRALVQWPRFQKELEGDAFSVTSHISANETDFRNQIRTFSRNFKYLAVCGGDSSLTIAAEELLEKKFSGELKFLPAGSVNDIVLDIKEQSRGRKSAIFLGHLQTRAISKNFIGQANWGLGVVVNRWVGNILSTLPLLRPLQNFIGTLCIIFAHLLRREIVRLEITIDGRVSSDRYSLVLVSQIKYWAGGLKFCPNASYHAPAFQIVTIRRCGLVRLIRIILAAKTGGHLNFPEAAVFTGKKIKLVSVKPVAVQIDGDILREHGKEIQDREYSLNKKRSALRLTL